MFATRVRVRPCSERCSLDSVGRLTTTVSCSTATRISGWTVRVSSPFWPLTTRVWSRTFTVTPLGILTGSLPIRLISPHETQDLAAEARLGCLLTGHDAVRGGQDTHPQPAQDSRDFGLAGVDPQAGLADPAHAGQGLPPGVLGFEDDLQLWRPLRGGRHVVADVALLFQDAGNLHRQLGRRQRDARVGGGVGVADAGQHVGDSIRAHPSLTTKLS